MKKRIYSNPVGVGRYTGLLLIAPFIAGFLLFTLYPFVCSFAFGLTEYDNVRPPEYVGADNYRRMLHDDTFRRSVGVTLKYAVLLVPMKLLFSLLTALLLSAEIRGIGIYRTVFYIPSILGSNLAVVIMWQYLFTSGGLVNQFLGIMGASPVNWYGDPDKAIFVIILLRLWEFGSTMIIFLTALKAIPAELYEAAKVDGCGRIRSFFSITLPQLKNVIFVNLVLQTIAAFQEFNAPYMLTGGGPMKSTYTVGMMIYDEMFRFNDMNVGYANALSWVLFVIISAVTGIMFAVLRHGREGDER